MHLNALTKLEKEKARAKQYLIKQNWTESDMTNGEWFTNKYGYTCYGKQTDNRLEINTKGVCIWSDGSVTIAYYDERGHVTRPVIVCSANGFDIYE